MNARVAPHATRLEAKRTQYSQIPSAVSATAAARTTWNASTEAWTRLIAAPSQ